MKEIPLTQGQVTLVDDADFEWLSQWKWHAIWAEHTQSFYTVRRQWVPATKVYVRIWMARLIVGVTGSKVQVDHRNGHTLDNQRQNLRVATGNQNQANAKLRKDSKTGFKGVTKVPWGKYKAQLRTGGKDFYLGLYATPEEAASAYREKALEVFGEFARTDC